MNKKQLALQLSKLAVLPAHDPGLEQYQIEGELAASLLWFAFLRGDIEGKRVADLGCGSGYLGIGSLLLGARSCFFVDVDRSVLDVAVQNVSSLSLDGASFLCSDVSSFDHRVDTVVMNPPFGVQTAHADRVFLSTAFSVASSVYSLHTLESKNFLSSFALEHGFTLVSVEEVSFLLKKTYSFHRKEKYSVPVGLFVFVRNV